MGSSSAGVAAPGTEHGSAVHDFDFYMGTWRVHHRRLKERLAGNDEWHEIRGHLQGLAAPWRCGERR